VRGATGEVAKANAKRREGLAAPVAMAERGGVDRAVQASDRGRKTMRKMRKTMKNSVPQQVKRAKGLRI
jgi:hypothetical protein